MQRLVLAGLVAATLGSVSVPAAARSNVDVYLSFGPPPVRYEYVPAPRVGLVWVPGYWDRRGHRYVWVGGHWLRHRPAFYHQQARWGRPYWY